MEPRFRDNQHASHSPINFTFLSSILDRLTHGDHDLVARADGIGKIGTPLDRSHGQITFLSPDRQLRLPNVTTTFGCR